MREVPPRESSPPKGQFLRDVVEGLNQPQKRLPSKYFYDERGSRLFERICRLAEYYPTRTEVDIIQFRIDEIGSKLGPQCILVEYGSGSSLKTEILLDHLESPAAYVPVDISLEHLEQTAARLAEKYPDLAVLPVCADFTQPFELPPLAESGLRRVVFFPGSTIGNFTPPEAVRILRQIGATCGPDGGLLIGVDLQKDVAVLERAYNDRAGVTAEFNRNILKHINRELGADFHTDQFRHYAFYNDCDARIEMHLVSETDQTVRIREHTFHFARGETIHTENSHKYSRAQFEKLAAQAGFKVDQVWTDPRELFSVQYLSAAEM